MKKFILFLLFFELFSLNIQAQILDDEEPVSNGNNNISIDTTTQDEELFNDVFSEYSEEERDINKIKTAIENKQTSPEVVSTEELPPVEGELLIGTTKGSFRIFKDVLGRTRCSFGVTLKSTLNRDIRNLALKLHFNKGTFAFLFKNLKANGADEKFIVTSGDICYNFDDVPDIDINMCKIKAAPNTECAQRIKWDANLESPDPKKNPYL